MNVSAIVQSVTGAKRGSLRERAFTGSAWTLAGYGAHEILRLASNLVLTRLLVPEMFGLMALVQVFMQGLNMFSDIGIQPNIVRDKRGEDPNFLNTAWTMGAVRGVVLWLCACIGAIPFSLAYGEPQLAYLLPLVGLNALLGGFKSTGLALANRKLEIGRLTILDLSTQVITIVIMVAWAWYHPSVWALAVGGLVGGLVKLIVSHIYFAPVRHRFQWEKQAVNAIFTFGRWIFLSTILAFIATKGDRFLMGAFFPMEFLGFCAIAGMISGAVSGLSKRVGQRVLFPAYARIEHSNPKRLYSAVRRSRVAQIAPTCLAAIFIVFLGQAIADLLYDSRYEDVGWIMSLLAVGTFANIVVTTYGKVLLAKGRSFEDMLMLFIHIVFKFAFMVGGFLMAGEQGFVIGIVAAAWTRYPIMAFVMRRLNCWQPELDLPALFVGVVVVIIASWGQLMW